MKHSTRCFALVVAAIVIAGCGTTQVALRDSGFPRPLIDPLPMNVGLHFAPGFDQYEHDEELRDHGRWQISLGPAQASLFRGIVPAMFNSVEAVDAIENGSHLDAVLSVSLQDFQFSVPRQTRSTFYEVWLRYDVEMFDSAGRSIARWPLTGYGKADQDDHSFLSARSKTVLQDAATIALRDAGAFLALGFAQQADVKTWLERRGLAQRARQANDSDDNGAPAGAFGE
jgi:hypothetical protein